MSSVDGILSTHSDSFKGFTDQNDLSEKTIAILEQDYSVQSIIGRGSFGNIYKARKTGENRSLALKIVPQDRVSHSELTVWSQLEHASLLKLENLIDLSPFGGYVFVTAALPNSLNQVITSSNFAMSPEALAMVRTWTRDILRGLEYLQAKGLAHLDIKTSNILIGSGNEAVVCDFGFLTSSMVPTRKYGIFLPYGPPERFKAGMQGHNAALDGVAADMWCMGILVLNCLSKQSAAWKLDKFATDWASDLYPDLFAMLELKNLSSTVERKLIKCPLDEGEISKIRNFVTLCLRLDPKGRPTAKDALKHAWFCEDSEELLPDPLWETKASSKEISSKIFVYQQEILDRIKASRTDIKFSTMMRHQVRYIIRLAKEIVEKNIAVMKTIPKKPTDNNTID